MEAVVTVRIQRARRFALLHRPRGAERHSADAVAASSLPVPFVALLLGGAGREVGKTHHIHSTTAPVWNAAFTITVPLVDDADSAAEEPGADALTLAVYDHHRLWKNKLLGQAHIALLPLLQAQAPSTAPDMPLPPLPPPDASDASESEADGPATAPIPPLPVDTSHLRKLLSKKVKLKAQIRKLKATAASADAIAPLYQKYRIMKERISDEVARIKLEQAAGHGGAHAADEPTAPVPPPPPGRPRAGASLQSAASNSLAAWQALPAGVSCGRWMPVADTRPGYENSALCELYYELEFVGVRKTGFSVGSSATDPVATASCELPPLDAGDSGGTSVAITVIEATGLPSSDRFHGADPYAKIIWSSGEVAQGFTDKHTLAPRWDLRFVPLEPEQSFAIVEVWDRDLLSSDDFIGLVDINLEAIPLAHAFLDEWHELKSRTGVAAGRLHVRIERTRRGAHLAAQMGPSMSFDFSASRASDPDRVTASDTFALLSEASVSSLVSSTDGELSRMPSFALSPLDASLSQQVNHVFLHPMSELWLETNLSLYTSMLTVNDEHGGTLFAAAHDVGINPSHAQIRTGITELVMALARAFLPPPRIAALDATFAEYMAAVPMGEEQRGFRAFLHSGTLAETEPLSLTFKCLAEDLLFPAYAALRRGIFEEFPFASEPYSGARPAVVITLSESRVDVVHTRQAVSLSQDPAEAFSFVWQVELAFDVEAGRTHTPLRVDLRVLSHQTAPGMPKYRGAALVDTLSEFVCEKDKYEWIWRRPFADSLVGHDIPRLAKAVTVLARDGTVLYADGKLTGSPAAGVRDAVSSMADDGAAVVELMVAVAHAIDDANTARAVCLHAPAFLTSDGSLGDATRAYLISRYFNEDSAVARVLKTLSQDIIMPSVKTLRSSFYERFPYKDVRGMWAITVAVEDKHVTVEHVRREQSHDADPGAAFEFEWRLKLSFDAHVTQLFPELKITDHSWGAATRPNVQREVLDAMFPFLDMDYFVRQVWSQPLDKVPLHRDLLYTLRSLAIVDADGKHLYAYPQKGSARDCNAAGVRLVVEVLSTRVEASASVSAAILGAYDACVPATTNESDVSEELRKWLRQPAVSGSRTLRVLRCLSQSMLFPAMMKLRSAVFARHPYKDGRGAQGFGVHIQLQANEIEISLHKGQESFSLEPGHFFTFRWVLLLTLDASCTHLSSNLSIVDYAFNARTLPSVKASLREVWAPFLIPTTPLFLKAEDAIAVSAAVVHMIDVVDAVSNAVTRLPHTLHADSPALPGSLPVAQLLTSLRETLGALPHLPLVHVPVASGGDGGANDNGEVKVQGKCKGKAKPAIKVKHRGLHRK
ncbi:uncharacterized protein AMSG_04040 [Thecamonas trahens ATCC 50062]|uniref:C2 domain-containing protein n=1 Tax=Thecamonas trahens ATCC 50062 TaxID=461836 RepID=A0A0L0D6T3_THETB|nr:hypothetical protein AMSG_04040 [Thecamonas trahens ATCC 50062]KNC47811.1 hypothetical protein AMSG_04040 [Thecamonas trahens ATCC 50062]|eukprot:XP_013759289.1 hypothetical protein AMSG_04040 [Thecamonas trahens ATCC 50062]